MVSASSRPPGAAAWRSQLTDGLLAGLRPDGSFGVRPYRKWTGGHWRLVALAELGVAGDRPEVARVAGQVLDWLAAPSPPRVVAGRERRHASIEGNALFACSRLGLAHDARSARLVETLLGARWPDGGWNCDPRPAAAHSSFHETVTPIRGLAAYHAATGDSRAGAAARRGAELLLEHRIFRRSTDGRVIHPEMLHIHWPPYWHYDFFIGLRAVHEAGLAGDERAEEALDRLRALRRPDGTWCATGRRYWRPPGSRGASGVEAVDWGDATPILTELAARLLGDGGPV